MLATNDLNGLKNFAKYSVVKTTRQSDGVELVATRVVIDEKRPVRWDVELRNPRVSAFTKPVMTITEPLTTSKLVKRAAEEGFGDWYPPIEEMVDIFPIDKEGDNSKKQRAPKYVEPDKTDYLVD